MLLKLNYLESHAVIFFKFELEEAIWSQIPFDYPWYIIPIDADELFMVLGSTLKLPGF
jgi:hypothetical protein